MKSKLTTGDKVKISLSPIDPDAALINGLCGSVVEIFTSRNDDCVRIRMLEGAAICKAGEVLSFSNAELVRA